MAFVVALVVGVIARDAHAQGVGFSSGFAVDPAQVYVGTHLESGTFGGHLRIRPGIDGAFGGGLSEALIDFAFLYEIPFGALSQWFAYQGSGPTVVIERDNGQHHTTAGFLGIFGVGNKNGFFFETKISGGGGPTLRVGIGYTIRLHQP